MPPRVSFGVSRITVNGDEQTLETPCTIKELADRLGLRGAYAVEVNRILVPRRDHAEHRLEPGDSVEIVTLVGGG